MPVPKPVYDELYEKNATAWIMSTQAAVEAGLEAFSLRILNTTRTSLNTLALYIDIDYMLWIRWLLSPLVITFIILPSLILVFIYISSLILYIYRAHRERLLRRIPDLVEQGDFWMVGRQIVSTLWDAHAWLWHGYEIKGLENLPVEGGCMLLYYHGAIPIDYYYLVNRILLVKGVIIHSVVDKFLFKVPGMKIILDVFCCTPGTVDDCAQVMKDGKLLGISPGGVYEAQFGDHSYQVLWRDRKGFARAAIKAKVPIVPIFTENVREAFRVTPIFEKFFYWVFNKTKLPLRPLFGGFPVKLTTHIGAPIYVEEGVTPEALRDECKASLEALISGHQRIPGSILRGIIERVWKKRIHSD